MTKNIVLIAVIAAIMIAGTLAVITTSDAYASQSIKQKNKANIDNGVIGDGNNGNHNGNAYGHDKASGGDSLRVKPVEG
jgi:hypothetical protein